MENEISFKKDHEKLVLLQSLIKIIVKLRAEKICANLYHPPNIPLRCIKYCAQKRLCNNTVKRDKLKVYISLKSNKLACFKHS